MPTSTVILVAMFVYMVWIVVGFRILFKKDYYGKYLSSLTDQEFFAKPKITFYGAFIELAVWPYTIYKYKKLTMTNKEGK